MQRTISTVYEAVRRVMEQHGQITGSGGKVVLSPLAIIVLGILAPIVGSAIKDRILTGQSTATTQTEVEDLQRNAQSLSDTLKTYLQTDAVHRTEFNNLQQDEQQKVGKPEFDVALKGIDEKLSLMEDDIKEIKEALARRH